MKKHLVFPGLILLACSTAFGQSAAPAPKPTPTPDDNQVVKISTNLIQIDVTVTDKNGKAVSDLRPDEIEIFENGQKQKITNFSFIAAGQTVTEKPKPVDKNAVPLPPSPVRPEQIRRTIALVVDDLSLSWESSYHTRRALKKFVDEQMQDGDLVAIVRTGAGIGALQQFTSDKRMLYAAIEKVKWNPLGTGKIGAFAPVDPINEALLNDSDETAEMMAEAMQNLEEFRGSVFATGTLGALRYIVTGMSELPGRKSVILFSDGFRLFEQDRQGFQSTGTVMGFMRQLVETANRASVVFYTIDPRGLVYTGATAADSITSPTSLNNLMSSRSAELKDTQDGPRFLAAATGGFAVVNNNDIPGGVRRVMEDQSYYLVGYDPDSDTFDPVRRRFNKLEVKVLRKGLNVRYRSGFFNVADRERPAENVAAAGDPNQWLFNALVSPFSVSGINLRLNALFGSDEKNLPFVRSLLHVDASDLKFTDEADGKKKAVFDVVAMSFGDNGQPVDRLWKTYTLNLTPERYKLMTKEGFVYHFVFPVKNAGAYQYRVAIRDHQGGKVGSASQFIDVPNVKKKKLTTSSILLENLSAAEWQAFSASTGPREQNDVMADTALRRARLGSVLRYGFEIYNARLDSAKQPKLTTRVRVFRDGKMILDGEAKPVDLVGQADMQHIKVGGAIALGAQMTPGDYVLQIVVTDQPAGKKPVITTQFVQFEVIG
jgi:VWFA-related protein